MQVITGTSSLCWKKQSTAGLGETKTKRSCRERADDREREIEGEQMTENVVLKISRYFTETLFLLRADGLEVLMNRGIAIVEALREIHV